MLFRSKKKQQQQQQQQQQKDATDIFRDILLFANAFFHEYILFGSDRILCVFNSNLFLAVSQKASLKFLHKVIREGYRVEGTDLAQHVRTSLEKFYPRTSSQTTGYVPRDLVRGSILKAFVSIKFVGDSLYSPYSSLSHFCLCPRYSRKVACKALFFHSEGKPVFFVFDFQQKFDYDENIRQFLNRPIVPVDFLELTTFCTTDQKKRSTSFLGQYLGKKWEKSDQFVIVDDEEDCPNGDDLVLPTDVRKQRNTARHKMLNVLQTFPFEL